MRIARGSATWQVVQGAIDIRLQELRDQLEKPDLDHTKTLLARGEVKALKELSTLPERVTQIAADDPGYGTNSLED